MRLSKLHITGFKSFPDRAELGFDDGVTAIVGPNGCGKSNVVDAITWVLGEQSAKSLRGERMEDVIFNGSDARKPTAAAEVRLKLADVAQAAMTAATEVDAMLDGQPLVTRDVEIGRRLYRSGESEYLIDGEVCRLRDVHDLLMDSGLGVKAYAVIEQGKIGQILSSRPAERRALIEEAAGVTKYKSRRRAAELKLEAAQHNLTRVDDIIFEVEKQRGALKRQAARARRYQRLREELRRWEQVQYAHRHETLARDIEAAERRFADATAREAAAAARVAELETALEALRIGLTEAESGATAAREAAHGLELEIGRRQQQIQFEQQQIEELARQATAYGAELEDLEARRGPAEASLAAQRDAARDARLALDGASARVSGCEDDYGRAQRVVQAAEQDSDTTRAAVLASGATLSALHQARDHAAGARDRVAAECERLEIEARELAADVTRTEAEQQAARIALDAARADLETARDRRAAAELDFGRRRADRERTTQQLAIRERDLAAQEARLRSLEELEASRATFGDAARFLLGDANSTVRHDGAVADHLAVERSYERAVDALLGDVLQYVVVERTEDVTAALALLVARDAGRCGFVVLDEARGPAAAETPLVVPSGSRALESVVRTTGVHAKALARVIGRALIADSFETARALARTVSVPVASMTGEVFRGAWLVQGGSRQDVRGILETRAEALALRESVPAAAADVHALSTALAAIDAALPGAESDLAALVADHHQREKDIVGLEARAARAEEERDRVARRRDVVALDHRRARDEAAAAELRREEAVGGDRHARAAASGSGRPPRRHPEPAAAGARARRGRDAPRDRGARRRGRAHRARRRARHRGRASRRRRDRARAAHDRAPGGHRADRGPPRRAPCLDRRSRTRPRHRGGRARRPQGRDARARRARHRPPRGVQRPRSRHPRRAARARRRPQGRVSGRGLADESGLRSRAPGRSLSRGHGRHARRRGAGGRADGGERRAGGAGQAARGHRRPRRGRRAVDGRGAGGRRGADARRRDRDLKKKIDRLGPVNMMAIEQFDELETRHTFLTTQKKDLLDSIAQTGEAIRKIDKTTRERFEEAFVAINQHFEQTFTTLFGGGRAGLVLIDQENDPESGIDIIAQPPGKRLQNVQLLSGGEKALTAMALMFAIFKYRPSPFCLLDEIDAPLDDANIGRFVEMLQGMQGHTQFILITHNRKTMEIADRLYGVTMEEPGVSKLISVSLN